MSRIDNIPIECITAAQISVDVSENWTVLFLFKIYLFSELR